MPRLARLPALAAVLVAAALPLPARPGEPAPVTLREATAEQREKLKDRRLQVAVTLKDGSRETGTIESYTPGKDGLPGAYVLTSADGRPRALYDVEVVKVEVLKAEEPEAARDPHEPHPGMLQEWAEAVRTGRGAQFIAKHETALRKAATIPEARTEVTALALAYRQHLGLDRKQLRERLMVQVDGVENLLIRAELRRALQDERVLLGRPLRPNGGRGFGPGGPGPKE